MRTDLHHPWTEQDDARLVHLYDVEQLGPSAIALAMRRKRQAVATRLTRLRKEGKVTTMRGRGGRPRSTP